MSEHIWLVCWGPGVSVEGDDWALEDIQVDDDRWVYKIDDALALAAKGGFGLVMREMTKGLHAIPTFAGRRPVFYTGPLTYEALAAQAIGHEVSFRPSDALLYRGLAVLERRDLTRAREVAHQ